MIKSLGLWLGTILLWELVLHQAVFSGWGRSLPALGFSCAASSWREYPYR